VCLPNRLRAEREGERGHCALNDRRVTRARSGRWGVGGKVKFRAIPNISIGDKGKSLLSIRNFASRKAHCRKFFLTFYVFYCLFFVAGSAACGWGSGPPLRRRRLPASSSSKFRRKRGPLAPRSPSPPPLRPMRERSPATPLVAAERGRESSDGGRRAKSPMRPATTESTECLRHFLP